MIKTTINIPNPAAELAQAIYTLAYVMKAQAFAQDNYPEFTSQERLWGAVKTAELSLQPQAEIVRHLLEYLRAPFDQREKPKPPSHLQIVK